MVVNVMIEPGGQQKLVTQRFHLVNCLLEFWMDVGYQRERVKAVNKTWARHNTSTNQLALVISVPQGFAHILIIAIESDCASDTMYLSEGPDNLNTTYDVSSLLNSRAVGRVCAVIWAFHHII